MAFVVLNEIYLYNFHLSLLIKFGFNLWKLSKYLTVVVRLAHTKHLFLPLCVSFYNLICCTVKIMNNRLYTCSEVFSFQGASPVMI